MPWEATAHAALGEATGVAKLAGAPTGLAPHSPSLAMSGCAGSV